MEGVPFETYLLPAIVAMLALAWGAEKFVDGASSLSFNMGMSPLLVGILVMGFGTSLPELLVSIQSSASGNSGLSLGNAYGSNIINIGLILGLAALLSPVIVQKHVMTRELPLLLLATVVTAWLIMDYELSGTDGIILLALFLFALIYLVQASMRDSHLAEGTNFQSKLQENSDSLWQSAGQLTIGLIVIAICSAVLVWIAKGVVSDLGISQVVVGVVVLALGTSLPELAVIVVAAKRGEHELALGNLIGSNLFNTLAVAGLASVIAPYTVDPELVTRDLPVMFVFTAVLAVMAYGWGRRTGVINKVEAVVLMLAFATYIAYLIYQTPIAA